MQEISPLEYPEDDGQCRVCGVALSEWIVVVNRMRDDCTLCESCETIMTRYHVPEEVLEALVIRARIQLPEGVR